MPELPEVETVRRGLEPVLAGARLSHVELRRADLRFPFPPRFTSRLEGALITGLRRRGKFLLAPTDRDETLLMHLGMTGRFAIGRRDDPTPAARHAHVVFETDAGFRVTFFDARRFGSMDLIASDDLERLPPIAGLGPEPFDDAFDGTYLAARFAGRRQGVKSLLLDQRVVAGLGNIYVSEALHRARIAPARPAGVLGRKALERIASAARAILSEAIASGGSTLRDYAAADGSPGYFQHRFAVYGRDGERCFTPGCRGLIRRTVQAGRASFHCPSCQK